MAIENPFVFGKAAEGPYFTDRVIEQSVKKALLKKDLVDVDGKEISFNDSLFKQWLKRQKFYD